MKRVLVTGSQGFIGSYLCEHLLDRGYTVVGVDNYSKYGPIARPHDNRDNFELVKLDVATTPLCTWLPVQDFSYIIAGAAMIGGISYFHKYAYDLLATNERILANTFDFAIACRRYGYLRRIVVMSSSMVFENTTTYPTPETETLLCPPPSSTYGFQKLACEFFAKGALEQYGLPYTVVRPFNCVGVGEEEAIPQSARTRGNEKLQLSHVLPDLVKKVLSGQDPLEILGQGNQVRCYTNGKDVARGIVLAMESEVAENAAFNISTKVPTTVLELAEKIWRKIRTDEPRIKLVPPYKYDVQKRIPDVTKARELLGFDAEITLDQSIDEVISWMKQHI